MRVGADDLDGRKLSTLQAHYCSNFTAQVLIHPLQYCDQIAKKARRLIVCRIKG